MEYRQLMRKTNLYEGKPTVVSPQVESYDLLENVRNSFAVPDEPFILTFDMSFVEENEVKITFQEQKLLELSVNHERRKAGDLYFERHCNYVYKIPETVDENNLIALWTKDNFLVIKEKKEEPEILSEIEISAESEISTKPEKSTKSKLPKETQSLEGSTRRTRSGSKQKEAEQAVMDSKKSKQLETAGKKKTSAKTKDSEKSKKSERKDSEKSKTERKDSEKSKTERKDSEKSKTERKDSEKSKTERKDSDKKKDKKSQIVSRTRGDIEKSWKTEAEKNTEVTEKHEIETPTENVDKKVKDFKAGPQFPKDLVPEKVEKIFKPVLSVATLKHFMSDLESRLIYARQFIENYSFTTAQQYQIDFPEKELSEKFLFNMKKVDTPAEKKDLEKVVKDLEEIKITKI